METPRKAGKARQQGGTQKAATGGTQPPQKGGTNEAPLWRKMSDCGQITSQIKKGKGSSHIPHKACKGCTRYTARKPCKRIAQSELGWPANQPHKCACTRKEVAPHRGPIWPAVKHVASCHAYPCGSANSCPDHQSRDHNASHMAQGECQPQN